MPVVPTFCKQHMTAGAELTTKRLFRLLPRNGFLLFSTKQVAKKWLYWVARKPIAKKMSFLSRHKMDHHETKKSSTVHEMSCHNTSFWTWHCTSLPRKGIFLTRHETSCQETNFLNDNENIWNLLFKLDYIQMPTQQIKLKLLVTRRPFLRMKSDHFFSSINIPEGGLKGVPVKEAYFKIWI